MGSGLVKGTYDLVHSFLKGQTTSVTDIGLTGQDLSYTAGWVEVESPEGWVLVLSGPENR